jgi:hypothetical protein
MGRRKINDEETIVRLPAGTLKRADALLREREARAELLRLAVEREIERRERNSQRKEARREARG